MSDAIKQLVRKVFDSSDDEFHWNPFIGQQLLSAQMRADNYPHLLTLFLFLMISCDHLLT